MLMKLQASGYVPRRPEVLALQGLLAQRNGSARVMLLSGPPGAGKTAFAEAVARALGGPFLYCLLHSWSDDQELFCGVNVVAAVAGDSAHVRQPGVLARAAELSQQATPEAPVVVCLDEIDKVHERTEYLLLDFLQSGRVPLQPGIHIQARLENMVVILTTNGIRPLSDPLISRCRRVHIDPLPVEVLDRLVAEQSGIPACIARIARKVIFKLADQWQLRRPALRELVRMACELMLAESVDDVRLILAGWLGEGERVPTRADVAPLWAEVKKERR